MDLLADPILRRLRASLDQTYGSRIDRVVLFGSRARGDARPDFDYDVAVFLKEPESFWRESGRLADIETDILYDTGAVINALPLRAGLDREDDALTRELARDRRELVRIEPWRCIRRESSINRSSKPVRLPDIGAFRAGRSSRLSCGLPCRASVHSGRNG